VTNYQRTESWLKACGKYPCPQHLSTQIGCHLEEMAEFLSCLAILTNENTFDRGLNIILSSAIESISYVGEMVKTGNVKAIIDARIDALDALCDTEVTGNGVAYLAGFNKDAADIAVLDSNDAKLVDGKPVFKPGTMKIGKPEGWIPPSLSEFV